MNKYSFDLDPAHIGELVAIQIFKRNEPDGDLIDPSSLVKHVGILEGYNVGPVNIQFWLRGGVPVWVNKHNNSIEVYPMHRDKCVVLGQGVKPTFAVVDEPQYITGG